MREVVGYGRVETVYDRTAGTQVSGTFVGDNTTVLIAVDSTYDFAEAGGSFQHLESGNVLAYVAVDEDSGTITLAAGLSSGITFTDGDTLVIQPQGSTRWANVRMDDAPEEAAIEMRVNQAIRSFLPIGVRDGLADGETVEITQIDRDDYLVTDIVGDDPQLQSETLGAITVSAANVLPDGVVPGAVTGVTATGGKAFIFLKWNAVVLNAIGATQGDLVKYKVYASTSPSLPLDATTQIGDTFGTTMIARQLASGADFKYDTTYYFAVQPTDADGAGAVGITNGVMNRLGTDDLLVGSITAGLLETVMVLGTTITTRASDDNGELVGPGITLAPDSLVAYDAAGNATLEVRPDSSPAAVFRGDAEIDHLTVQTLTTLQQTLLSQGSALTMQKGVSSPSNPPSVVVDWETVNTEIPGFNGLMRGFSLSQYKDLFFTFNGSEGYIERYSMDDGSLDFIGDNVLPTTSGRQHVCYAPASPSPNANTGNWLWMVKIVGSQWYLQRWNPSTLASAGADIPITINPATGAAVGVDSVTGQIMVGYVDATTFQFTIKRYTCTSSSGASASLDSTWTSGTSTTFSDITSVGTVLYGNFDFGTPVVIFKNIGSTSSTGYPTFVVINPTTKLRDTAKEWDYGPSPLKLVGLTWDGANFKALFHDNLIRKYEAGNTWTASGDSKWWAAYTWSDGTLGTALPASSAANSAKLTLTATGAANAAGTGKASGSAQLALTASGTAAAVGSTTFADNFNRADAPTLGSNWVQPSTSNPFQIIGTMAAPGTSTTVARWITDPNNPSSVFSQFTLSASIPASSFVGPCVKLPTMGTTLANTGEFYCLIATTTGLSIRAKGIGTSALTILGSAITFTVNVNDVMRLEYDGTDLVGKINGVEQIRRAEALLPISTGGNGVGFYSTGNSANRFNFWSGG